MSHKIRVHQLAKEFDMESKDLIEIIKNLGLDVASHLSGLTDEEAKIIRDELKQSGSEDKSEKKDEKQLEKDEGSEDIEIIKIPSEITLKEFAEKISVNPADLIKELFMEGKMFKINDLIPFEIAEEIALKKDIIIEKEEEIIEEDFGEKFNLEKEDNESDLKMKSPVVTIMGHVDHGKTSLLDAIRKTQVADGEAGGITQKIGAYQIEKNGKKITFIDTPGHEAFTEMRARGANITDVAVLIVAADDGVMPQTEEAISHAKAAGVPIIVAINKIDKPNANPEKVKRELLEHGLPLHGWGGDTEYVEISALKRINLDDLLELILLTTDVSELKANPNKRAKGVVLESRLDKQIGPVADILIQEGTLKIGNTFVSGSSYGRVRSMMNDKGKKVKKALPSMPVEVTGFDSVPQAGDVLYVVQNKKKAREIADEVVSERKIKEQQERKHVTFDDLHNKIEKQKLKELRLIIKADSRGSIEALKKSLARFVHDEVRVTIIHATSGAITEGDVKLAEASDAIIIGFHVRPRVKALKEADREGVEIRTYNVIYHITEDIEKALTGMLDAEYKEVYQGRLRIQEIFKVSKIGNIAGCIVTDGKIHSDSKIRILRNGEIIHEGELETLKRYSDDVKEVAAPKDCGVLIKEYNDIKVDDEIEAYTHKEVKRTL
ncbi:MAG: translation initiation factor IF-2 [Fusobacteriota bacterium]